jgi:UDP-N-acetylglucosamine/UDP-N-acetylgalactosamine diphosphorylase
MRQRDTDGELIYRWGSPAMLCWSVPFLARTVRDGGRLPLHRSAKPLTAWVEGARREVRGWKCERFIFDLLPLARRGVGLEIDRAEEFGPIKNATGEDSVDSARRLLRERARRWLAAYGVEVSSAARVEIGPLYAATAAGLRARRDLPARITGDRLLDETPPAAPGSRRPGVC